MQNELKEIKDSKKFIITSNGFNLIVNYKCDLKISYQTENQLTSRSGLKMWLYQEKDQLFNILIISEMI